jgi:hypothetical protein
MELDGCRKHLLSNTNLAGGVGYIREWKQIGSLLINAP